MADDAAVIAQRCRAGDVLRTQPADADSRNLADPAARQPELAVRRRHHMTHDASARRNRPFLERRRARIEAHERIRLDLGFAVPDRAVSWGGHAARAAVERES